MTSRKLLHASAYLLCGGIAGLSFLWGSCTRHRQQLQDGVWRAELLVSHGRQAPFLFEVANAKTDSAVLTLINGEEKTPLTNIRYAADSVIIPIEAYDALIKVRVLDGALEGRFIKSYIEGDTGVPFKARRGEAPRFAAAAQPTAVAVDGKWDILFASSGGDTARNVGIFKTENQMVTGSILTSSGDLRFLEGAPTATGVQLSAFSGLTPYYIELSFTDSSAFEGALYTARGKTTLIGSRNDHAALVDPYSLTKLKRGYNHLGFRLPNADGQELSLADERYRGKVVIVSVLGTWCPNCLDEAQYLAQWYRENRERGVEIVGLSFERKDDLGYARAAVSKFKKRYGVEYEVLLAGKVGGESVAKVLPEVDGLSSYPTTFFVDKKGRVAKIYTGFNGPATGLFYEEWKKDFNDVVDGLIEIKN
ncbi:MAG: TlpA family protein disulfide reductase [Prevotellaceae bacterium]|nr:TlpA family protein disulfide reductase [Prevotellaceae bacterium]